MLILRGLFRKCVIADNCALIANAAFGGALGRAQPARGRSSERMRSPGRSTATSAATATSREAAPSCSGFHFMVNFRQPYLATSLQDFWRRWHISLSTWLRDYLYIPLGGNRDGESSEPIAT